MCTELVLALLYFFVICVVNYFLFRLLISYYKNTKILLAKKKALN